jgi:endonuclease/exonuclease/phosphatase family metal-dependent hydrolase
MIKIAAWNIEGRLSAYSRSGRGSPDHIIRTIIELDADILFLVEAYGVDPKRDLPLSPDIDVRLKELGYTIFDVDYDEGGEVRIDPAEYQPRFRLLYRSSVTSISIVRLGNLRNALVVKCIDKEHSLPFRFIGIHLDDRSEALRQEQLQDLIPLIQSSSLPTIMMGDYNAMHGTTIKSRILRSKAAKVLPKLPVQSSIKSVFKRTIEMASGTTLSALESETNLHDVDTQKRPTATLKMRPHEWVPSIRFIDIDHILVSDDVAVRDFTIGNKDGGSDHRPISATISF